MRPPEPEARMRERLGRLGLERPYVVAVGTVEPRKGLDTLATALCEARRSVPDLELAIVGPTGWLAVPGLEAPGIHRIGTIDERSLDAVYRHAVACAVASRYEGFGLPALEAMARGCPVIATNATSLPEVVGSAGTLVPLGDVEAWAHALVTTVRDGDLRAEMRRRGIERAAGFTWSGSAHAHAAAYESALDPGAAPRAHT
jgi:glycosyltransferase involved in cell wall biosynthesis